MQHAKKLILIEPRVLEQLQINNEYKDLQRHADVKSQALASMELRNLLTPSDIPDDIKAKIYQQALSRFLNLTDEIQAPTAAKINPLTRPQPPAPRRQQQQRSAAAETTVAIAPTSPKSASKSHKLQADQTSPQEPITRHSQRTKKRKIISPNQWVNY